ncbi:MAG: GNAT family N-acetyltransferase [Actinomycetota bacterium]
MAEERTRSEYRLTLPLVASVQAVDAQAIEPQDHEALAELMLDAYAGTVDDEGETMVEARGAIDHYMAAAPDDLRWVVRDGGRPIAFCCVVEVDDRLYVDPIVVAANHKRRRLGTALVAHAVAVVGQRGAVEVGAAITDGNVASENLFRSLGARRVGPWPPASRGSS